MREPRTIADIESELHRLNYRWKMDVLSLWKGEVPERSFELYDGVEELISRKTLARIDEIAPPEIRNRLRFALIDHYLQRTLLPHDVEMQAWMRGARAVVGEERIYMREIIPWCQTSSTYEKRQILQQETGPLCKFLKPFALNYWDVQLTMLKEELGFENYIDYCGRKKGIDYARYYELAVDLLKRTDDLYFARMEEWVQNRFGRPLSELNRFDAIKLLCLQEFDPMLHEKHPKDRLGDLLGEHLKDQLGFLKSWGINPFRMPHLHLDIGMQTGKRAQGMTFFLSVPEEIHVLMRPQRGWIDIETLWHELGHGLSAAHARPDLPLSDRNLPTAYSLSECYAFLLQHIAMTPPFTKGIIGLSEKDAQTLYYYKNLRDLSVFRRYAGKFISEYEMFSRGDLENGEPYAEQMRKSTGFYHQPESHLFDLVPEFYSLDYLLGWMGEAIFAQYLQQELGEGWAFSQQTGEILKEWWQEGFRYDIFAFFAEKGLGELGPEPLLDRWKECLA